MKAKEVLNLLRISQKTLHIYAKDGEFMLIPYGTFYLTGNTIRKAIPEAFANGIKGKGLYPRSLSIPKFTEMISSKGVC